MPVIRKTAQSEEDLMDIWSYIAQDNIKAADCLLDEIEEKFNFLLENPLSKQLRPDIAPEVRCSVVGQYLILYRTIEKDIQIVRVVSGARDLPNLF